MRLMRKILNLFYVEEDKSTYPSTGNSINFIQKNSIDDVYNSYDYATEPFNDTQTIYFKNGKLYKVYPTDEENWYDARYLVSDGKLYDLENIQDIQKIPPPDFSVHNIITKEYGITGSLDYVMRMKAGAFYNRNEKTLCSACLWKATQLMLVNKTIGWQKKDFDRLINWHLELGMYGEAEKAKKYLSNYNEYTENPSDRTAKSARDNAFKYLIEYNTDLVAFEDYGGGCCAECAKMRGRVYSISGKTKKYPLLPQYAKINGNFHPGCRCHMSPYWKREKILYKGKHVNAKKVSKRPWIDDRDKKEIELYEDYLKFIIDSEKKERDREEYYRIVKDIPEVAPKSFGAYRRMKNAKTKNFMKIVNTAKENGITIVLD